jgi:hypothetical protein
LFAIWGKAYLKFLAEFRYIEMYHLAVGVRTFFCTRKLTSSWASQKVDSKLWFQKIRNLFWKWWQESATMTLFLLLWTETDAEWLGAKVRPQIGPLAISPEWSEKGWRLELPRAGFASVKKSSYKPWRRCAAVITPASRPENLGLEYRRVARFRSFSSLPCYCWWLNM